MLSLLTYSRTYRIEHEHTHTSIIMSMDREREREGKKRKREEEKVVPREALLSFFLFFRVDVQMMIFSGIIFFLFVSTSEMNSSDDSFEILSVNTGEIATILCDLPERYSNQPVSSSSRNAHLSLSSRPNFTHLVVVY